jgi:hypothetical protein
MDGLQRESVLLYVNGLEISFESLCLRHTRSMDILKHWYLMAHTIGISLKGLLSTRCSLSVIHIQILNQLLSWITRQFIILINKILKQCVGDMVFYCASFRHTLLTLTQLKSHLQI